MNNNLIKLNIPAGVINLLNDLKLELIDSFNCNIISIYLHGSIVTGDFREDSSDIDYIVILSRELTQIEVELLRTIHNKLTINHIYWTEKLEGSYILGSELQNKEPPIRKRLYYNESSLRYERYGFEWIFEQYYLKNFGIEIYECDNKYSFADVSSLAIRNAALNLLVQEWKPRILDSKYIWIDEYLIYGVLSICRILYSIETGLVKSKVDSVAYVIKSNDNYIKLLNESLQWRTGESFLMKEDARKFIGSVIDKYK